MAELKPAPTDSPVKLLVITSPISLITPQAGLEGDQIDLAVRRITVGDEDRCPLAVGGAAARSISCGYPLM